MSAQAQFATSIVETLRNAGFQALWAGGCVRDLLRGAEPVDYDVATNARPDQVQSLFGKKRTVAVGAAFGVIMVLPPPGLSPVEVATFRTEGPYRDGRRPDSVVYATPEEDARRRDFTINGMFFDPLTREVLDYVGGQDDLHARVVRAIGDPHARMSEDKLRLLRAIRFASVLDFSLESTTAQAVAAMSRELTVVSAERIAQELRKMLVHPHRRIAVELCLETGLLEVIFPPLPVADGEFSKTMALFDALSSPSFGLSLAVLLRSLPDHPADRKSPPEPQTVLAQCRRLKLSNEETDSCRWLHAHQSDWSRLAAMDDAQLKQLLSERWSAELIQWFRAASRIEPAVQNAVDAFHSRTKSWTAADISPPVLVQGGDVLALGIPAGPEVKELLNEVRRAQLNGQVASRPAALELIRQLAGRRQPSPPPQRG
jgi:poly(A) polymerase